VAGVGVKPGRGVGTLAMGAEKCNDGDSDSASQDDAVGVGGVGRLLASGAGWGRRGPGTAAWAWDVADEFGGTTYLRAVRTVAASSRSESRVSGQAMQASVMLCP
jgi:hypothetical protein